MRPKLLDLFCGAGGCSVGYHRAGFDVVGVDNRPMPRYPFEFHQADALEFLADHAQEFDAIHASPPCQAFTSMRFLGKGAGKNALDLVDVTRRVLMATGKKWIIENVIGAPLRKPLLMLCGSMFSLNVRRHRIFESNAALLGQRCQHRKFKPVAVWGDGRFSRQEARAKARKERYVAVYGDNPQETNGMRPGWNRAETLKEASDAMGIDWMVWKEITQAIPPAYTQFIGKQLIERL